MKIVRVRRQLERLLRVEAAAKPAIYLQLYESTDAANLNYWLELLLSAGIATFGLVLDSPAVVIGAMLVSPLMGPILALGLALTLADLYLGLRASLLLAGSIVMAMALSAGIVWLLPFHVPTAEILARTRPNLLDLGVALLSGLAGSIVICRGGHGGGVTALPGVAIAVALMPPLCATGFGIGSGFSQPIMRGAGLLFVTNLAAIAATAFFTFFLVRMDAPDVHQQINEIAHARAERDWLYLALGRAAGGRSPREIGKLRWRVVMLVAALGILFVPLRQALMQVRDETVARAAVGEAIRSLASPGSVVSQRVDPTTNPILVRLVVTAAVAAPQIRAAELLVARRTGREVDFGVRRVASDDDLALLRQSRPLPPVMPPSFDFERVRQEVRAHLEAALKELWPSQTAELLESELGFDEGGVVVRLRYRSIRQLEPTVAHVMANALKARLAVTQCRVTLEYERSPRPRKGALGRSR